ncbi:3-isopropylmalate dehydrogenase [Paucilactobacillus nenjiangensis]|uniref:3-isopropylmalate dehydrogenase n=1 Tax=Paucilactobacillus nenjiangensis TaxID=1296540 RepID=UPI0010F5989E|nr:3-isopropylmalate dehydrogenase [Paucilactobacillus nenjiangensis]
MKNQIAQITALAGDYIGPEIMAAGQKVLATVAKNQNFDYQITDMPFGGDAIDKTGDPLPQETIDASKNADAILLAAIGGPKWDKAPRRPEQGLLQIRQELNLFANIRPTKITPAMMKFSPLKQEKPVDFVIVRELTSGIYFGTPREKHDEYALDTMRYTRTEIERIARLAFEMASKRRNHVTLVDKANVLDTSKFWREITAEVAQEFPNVTYDQSYVDAASMKIIASPEQFDVILTENLFGDILSDEAAQTTGSLGTIPSMSKGIDGPALYEPIHGSAPDIAGKGIANPFSMVKSVAMMLANSFDRQDLADQIMTGIDVAVERGIVTPDLGGTATTYEVTATIIDAINERRNSYATDNV